MNFFVSIIILTAILLLTLPLLTRFLRSRGRHQRANEFVIGFFHPYCNSGGGGERVLWQYVRMLQLNQPNIRLVIYTGDKEPSDEILQRAHERFNLPPITTVHPIRFVRLSCRRLITAEQWPRFTMFGQSLGSIILACEALWHCTPNIFIDTTGFAFTYPLASYLFGSAVHCYTHYPTISSDMLALVFERRESYNNSSGVAGHPLKARLKWVYYQLFAYCYSLAGRAADSVFVNSTWTRNHIDSLWNRPQRTHIVYPPCDTQSLQTIPLGRITTLDEVAQSNTTTASSSSASSSSSSGVREDLIISIGQFRPEKDHQLQLRSFASFLHKLSDLEKACPARALKYGPLSQRIRLVLIGGARDDGDRQRVDQLRTLADELSIPSQVDFELNVPFSSLKSWLSRATVGLHTMWNEHFGIGVVEFMAAGVITIAHNSGGPKSDILVPIKETGQPVGYLASTADEYANYLMEIFTSEFRGSREMDEMRQAARVRAKEFSDEVFMQQLNTHLEPFIQEQINQQQTNETKKTKAQ